LATRAPVKIHSVNIELVDAVWFETGVPVGLVVRYLIEHAEDEFGMKVSFQLDPDNHSPYMSYFFLSEEAELVFQLKYPDIHSFLLLVANDYLNRKSVN
jgi:hypothetical protein